MAMADEEKNRIRQLIFDFYEQHDPGKLRSGLDVSGMVEWTMKHGLENLNQLLFIQYQKQIDPSANVGSATDQVTRFSKVYAPARRNSDSASSSSSSRDSEQAKTFEAEQKKKNELRKNLKAYFSQNDPAKANDQEIERMVEYEEFNGREKLSKMLFATYGAGLNERDTQSFQAVATRIGSGANAEKEDFDYLKTKQELRLFYEKHDPAYVENGENLDKVVMVVKRYGRGHVDLQLRDFYGESWLEFLKNYNSKQVPALSTKEKIARNVEKQIGVLTEATQLQNVTARHISVNPVDDFNDIQALKEELIRYYKKHDPPELQNVDDVIDLGMEIGLTKLNAQMESFYGESLITFLEAEKARGKKTTKLRGNNAFIKTSRKEQDPYSLPPPPPPDDDYEPAMSASSEVSFDVGLADNGAVEWERQIRKKLETFYKIYAPEKLNQMDDIVNLARDIGETTLNVKLKEYFKVDLNDVDVEASPSPRKAVPSSAKPAYSTKPERKISNFSTMSSKASLKPMNSTNVPVMAKPPVSEEVSRELDSLRMSTKSKTRETYFEDIKSRYMKNGAYQINDSDMAQLEHDLREYYRSFDPAKLDALEKIVRLGAKIGRPALDAKLEALYGTGVNTFITELYKSKAKGKEIMKGLQSVDLAALRAKMKSTMEEKPNTSGKKKRRRKKKPSVKSQLSDRVDVDEIINQSMGEGTKRMTKARWKLMSVPIAKKEMPDKPVFKQRVPVQNIVRENAAFGVSPCDNYKLDMTAPTFGVCVYCGFTKPKHKEGGSRKPVWAVRKV